MTSKVRDVDHLKFSAVSNAR